MSARLALVAALAAASLPALAADPPAEPDPLDTVVVVGTRSAQSGNRLPAAVTVITRAAIERSGARHLVEVLRTAGAVQVSDLYGDGSRATVDLRAFGDGAHSTTLVLVDGRRLNNPDLAPPDLNSIALKDVERIEIIQGSVTTLYGDQATGGVINIVTRTPQRLAVSAAADAGSYGALGARASMSQRGSAASMRLSAESRGSDNYREHNAVEYKNVLGRVGYDFGPASVFVEGGLVDEDLETPGPLFGDELARDRRQSTPAFRRDFADTTTRWARLNWRQEIARGWALDTDYTHRRSDGDFRLGFASGFSSIGSQDRAQQALQPRLTGAAATAWGEALVTLGADAHDTDYRLDSAAFGEQRNDQSERDLYAQAVLPLPAALELTTGARQARIENALRDAFTFTSETRFADDETAGELGLAWRPAGALRLFGRYERNFRFAKVDELTNACPPAANVLNLRTQHGDSYEGGAELAAGGARVRVAAYRLELEDEIAFDGTACFGFGANVNLDGTRRDGVIVEGAWTLAEALWLDAALHHVDAEIAGGGATGRAIPLVPRDSGKLAVSARLPAAFSLRIEAQAVGERPFAGDFDNSLGRLPGFAVVNAAAGWTAGALRVAARVNNLLDREYAEYGAAGFDATFTEREAFFPSPERNYRVAVGAAF